MYIFYSFQINQFKFLMSKKVFSTTQKKYDILSDADSIKNKQNANIKKLRKKEM